MSIEGHCCQFNANRSPNCRCGEGRETLFSANSSICGCGTALLWDTTAVRRLRGGSPVSQLGCPVPVSELQSTETALLMSCSSADPAAPVREHNLQWKLKACSWSPSSATLQREKSPPLVSDWSVLLQISPKSTVSIGQNRAALIVQCIC